MSKLKSYRNKELIKRGLKYLIQWLTIFLALRFIPSKEINLNEIMIISTIGVVTFALLDMYSPSISDTDIKNISVAIGV